MKAKVWITLALVFPAVLFAAPPQKIERKLYVGKDSVEAKMSFSFAVSLDQSEKPSKAEAFEAIESQLAHLFGPMGEAKQKAVPKGDHELTLGKIEKIAEGGYSVSYGYSGTIVVHVPPSGLGKTYPIFLPFRPKSIYEESAVTNDQGETSFPCTDEHYDSEGDFWYFWNPKKAGCPLVVGEHYARIDAKIVKSENTRVSYPEYARLVNSQGQISVTLLFGMDDPNQLKNPLESEDISAESYRNTRELLVKAGYEGRVWTSAEIRKVSPSATGPMPYVEEFIRELPLATMKVRLFFGASGIDENSAHFHFFFKDALENDSVMVYDGHSGLGGHLDLPTIAKLHGFKFKIPKDKYQIYFFNSCSSYSYYNTLFFSQKANELDPRGTKNLDILTNGLATYFSVMKDSNWELLKALQAWASQKGSVTYQAIAKKIDSGNLFGVNGDEDNPKKP